MNFGGSKMYRVLTRLGLGTLIILGVVSFWPSGNTGEAATTLLTNATPVEVDGSLDTRTITVTGADLPIGDLITDVNVIVEFHKTDGTCAAPLGGSPYPNEIIYVIQSPAGTMVNLVTANTYSSASPNVPNVTVTFDDTAPAFVGGTPTSGAFRPVSPLSAFNNEDPQGVWTLFIEDTSTSDPLCHNSFSLDLSTFSPLPLTTSAACNGNDLEVTITDGNAPFNIFTDNGTANAIGVGTGVHVFPGPEYFGDVTVVETTGNGEIDKLGNFYCGPTPTVTITGDTVTEGVGGTFNLSINPVISADTTINFTVSDVSATGGGVDYTVTTGSPVTIPSGGSSTTIDFTTVDDIIFEGTETFNINITGANGSYGTATVAGSPATGTILDNEIVPDITIDDVTVTEGGGGSFTITMNSSVTQDTTVNFTVNDISATGGGVDYTVTSVSPVTILANQTTTTVDFTTVDDALLENTETFTIDITSATNPLGNPTVSDPQGLGTINDNEPIPDVTITGTTVTEGTGGSFSVDMTGPIGADTTVNFTVTALTATNGADYTVTTASPVTIPANSTNALINFTTVDDAIFETAETFRVNITSVTNPLVTPTNSITQATSTINDNEGIPDVTISDVAVIEGAGGSFTVNINPAAGAPTNISFSVTDVSATNGADYTVTSASPVTIPANATSTTINFTTVDDLIFEPSETFNIDITGITNSIVVPTNSDSQGVGTINDNDGIPDITINDVAVNEGAGGSFTITMAPAVAADTTINFTVADVTATGGGVDYTVVTASPVVITAGNTTATVDFTTVGDVIAEGPETFTVDITSATNALIPPTVSDPQGIGTINEIISDVSINDQTVTEGAGGTFTVTINPANSVTIVVDYIFVDGTATNPADYSPVGGVSGSLTFNPGVTTQTVDFTTVDDTISEGTENFTVNLTLNSGPGNIIDAQGLGTINDNDTAGVVVNPTSGLTTTEAGGTANFDVYLTTAPTGNVVINITSLDATEGIVTPSDPLQISFDNTNWDIPQTITVQGVDDLIVDGTVAYTVQLTMDGTTTDPVYLAIDPADVLINNADDDFVGSGLNYSPTVLYVSEINQPAWLPTAFSVSLQSAPSAGETVTVNLTYDTTQLVLDKNSLAFTSANWNVPQVVNVTAINDGIPEPNMNSPINLLSVSSLGAGSPFAGLTGQVMVIIHDDGNNIIGVVPNYGLIKIENWQAQRLYQSPSHGVIRTADTSEIFIPADYDKNGFDTYNVTDIRTYQGQTWLALWIGNMGWGWVPYDPTMMTIIAPLDWDIQSEWIP